MASAGGVEVARVSVRVVPNTDGFRRKTKQEVTKATKGLKAKVAVEPDLDNFRQKILAATKGLKAQVNVSANTSGVRREINTATKGHEANVKVRTSGVPAAMSKIQALKALVDRNMTAKVVIGNNPMLAAAYGAAKGWRGVRRVLQTVTKWALIAGVAITALAPPLAALGGGTAMAALAAWGAVGATLSAIATTGIAGGFIIMAAQSERVKAAWSATGSSIKSTIDEINQPVENSLVSLAPKISDAFKQIQPNLARLSQGTSELIDRFGTTLPDLADATGTALEQMFESGRPAMEKLIDGLPNIVRGLGNMFQTIGESDAVQRIWNGMVDGLPGTLEGIGRGFDRAARWAGKLFDWFKSPGLSDFRDGFSELWDEMKNVDWTRAREGVEDMLNSIGKIAGDTNFQDVVDNFGKAATAVSKLTDAFRNMGIGGTIAAGIVGGIAKGIAVELASLAVRMGAKWLLEKLFGTTTDIFEEALDVGIGAAGGFAEGFGEEIGEGLGSLIGDAISDLFGGDDEDANVTLHIKEVIWPGDKDGPEAKLYVTEVIWPGGGEGPEGPFKITDWIPPDTGPSGAFTVEDIEGLLEGLNLEGEFKISKIVWPDDTEMMTGDFQVTNILWPGDAESLSGQFVITEIVFPEGALGGLSEINVVLETLVPLLQQASEAFGIMLERLTSLNELLMPLAVTLTMIVAPLAMITGSVTLLGAQLMLLAQFLPPISESLNMMLVPMLQLPALVMMLSTGITMLSVGVTMLMVALAPLFGVITLVATAFMMWAGVASQVIGAISGIIGAVSNAAGTFSRFAGTVGSVVGSVIGFVTNMASAVVSAIQGAISNASSIWDGGWFGMNNTVWTTGAQIISFVASLPGRIMGALGDLGGLLVGSGQALIQGFIDGIRSMIDVAVGAAQAVVSAVRNLFPFSPAKEGPFSGKGYTTHSGRALMRDFGGGMLDARTDVVGAAEKVLRDVNKQFVDYNEGLILDPVLESNAKKIADFRKKEAEEIAKGTHDAAKAHEDYQKMLESLDTPDYSKMNLSFQSFYIDGAKGMLQKQIDSMNMPGQLKGSVQGAVNEARKHFGDHPFLADIETNINSEHFELAVQKVIEESDIAAVPVEFVISNLDQLKQDLGFGDGVISRAIDAGMNWDPNNSDTNRYKDTNTEVHYHVTDMQEAMRLEEERRRRGALRYV